MPTYIETVNGEWIEEESTVAVLEPEPEALTEPEQNPDQCELDILNETRKAIGDHYKELPARNEPLVIKDGQIVSGILWIPPFSGPSPFAPSRKKPVATKCICAHCGSKHNKKASK